jgi:alpha-L-arabinofuranosidase
MKKRVLQALALGLLAAPGVIEAQSNNVITVNTRNITGKISPAMWGVFFEDINMGADGGIYAELVKNRSFEFFKPLMGWTVNGTKVKEGDMLILNRTPAHTSNPRFLRSTVTNAAQGDAGLLNEGFRGMGIKQGLRYDFSVLYRQQQPGVRLHAQLLNSSGKVIGDTVLVPSRQDTGWHKQSLSFHATETEPKAKLQLWLEGSGTIDLDMISLFPGDTWKNRPGGMRADMIQLLADLKPGFIRFPGGCIVEGFDLSQRYQWKRTIGPIEERQLIINRWNFEFAHRPTPDYFQTFGLGFFEYFQLAEDLGAEPLPILNCGMACQFNSAELVPLEELDPYIQDALDLIEFANGDVNTKWGKVRANMGHPAPFNLKLLGVGNENWGPQYIERLKLFTKAIKEKYPDIRLVNSAGTDPSGDRFDYLNKELRDMHADIIDEHYYRPPQWFMQNARRYDNYPRNGSKIFAGEYAAQSDKVVSIHNKNNWLTALSEAAFMTGLERNADVVTMASYAPLFAHADGWQWTPDLIWVDNLRSFGTPNYYVQQLFSLNKGTAIVPARMHNDVIAGQDSLYASATLDEKSNELIIKLVNVSGKPQTCTVELDAKPAAQAKLTVLQSDDANGMNSFEQPARVSPESRDIKVPGKRFRLEAAPWSLSVLRVRL